MGGCRVMDLLTIEDTKQLLAQVSEKNEQLLEEQKTQDLNDFLSAIDNDEVDALTLILLQPDDVFEKIAPIFIEEIEKTFNVPANKITMLRALNASDLSVDDLKEGLDAVIEEIDKSEDVLSENKRNFLKTVVRTSYAAVSSIEGISRKIVAVPIVLDKETVLPDYQTDGAAAIDLRATEEITLAPGDRVLVGTGVKMAIPTGYAALVQPRSGLSLNSSLRVANTPGLIDSDYRGEIKVIVENIDPPIRNFTVDDNGCVKDLLYGRAYTIGKGERIAQLRLVEVPKFSFFEVNNLDIYETERGEGGFGSTDTK